MPTAILIDGGFFILRYRHLFGDQPAREVAGDLHRMCLEHLKQPDGLRSLYRIFFYDCPPLAKKVHHSLSGKLVDFSRTPTAIWRRELHDQLRRLRKVALRLGYLNDRTGHWNVRPEKLKALFKGQITARELAEPDLVYDVVQKGVDMRIGLDIAAMAFKRQVDQIILVAGDSDFVPAAKLARREGIDFVLDPLWASIREDLQEHIDGLRTIPKKRTPGPAETATAGHPPPSPSP